MDNLKRRVAAGAAAAAISVVAAASAASATGDILAAAASYRGARTVDVSAQVSDQAGDAYCTVTTARLIGYSGQQLGGEITLGSVCSGRTAWLPWKTISTAAGDIWYVQFTAYRGAGGPADDIERVYR